jgi:hypothetical protein
VRATTGARFSSFSSVIVIPLMNAVTPTWPAVCGPLVSPVTEQLKRMVAGASASAIVIVMSVPAVTFGWQVIVSTTFAGTVPVIGLLLIDETGVPAPVSNPTNNRSRAQLHA